MLRGLTLHFCKIKSKISLKYPVVFVHGMANNLLPENLAFDVFNLLDCADKRFIKLKNQKHEIMLDDPDFEIRKKLTLWLDNRFSNAQSFNLPFKLLPKTLDQKIHYLLRVLSVLFCIGAFAVNKRFLRLFLKIVKFLKKFSL